MAFGSDRVEGFLKTCRPVQTPARQASVVSPRYEVSTVDERQLRRLSLDERGAEGAATGVEFHQRLLDHLIRPPAPTAES